MTNQSSVDRVREAAQRLRLGIEIRRMPGSTRTAEEAAAQCGCSVGEIVKSLVFQGEATGSLFLFLLPGDRKLSVEKAGMTAGETLVRADPKAVRERTGFAIGGIPPIGHDRAVPVFADYRIRDYSSVWVAAGAPDAVFNVDPGRLIEAAGATLGDFAE